MSKELTIDQLRSRLLPAAQQMHEDKVRIQIDGVLKTSEKGYLINFGDMEDWVPKNQVEIGQDPDGLAGLCLDISAWLAKKKGLITGIVAILFLCSCATLFTPKYMQGNAYITEDGTCIKQRVDVQFNGTALYFRSENHFIEIRNAQQTGPGRFCGDDKISGDKYCIYLPKDPRYIMVITQGIDQVINVTIECIKN